MRVGRVGGGIGGGLLRAESLDELAVSFESAATQAMIAQEKVENGAEFGLEENQT